MEKQQFKDVSPIIMAIFHCHVSFQGCLPFVWVISCVEGEVFYTYHPCFFRMRHRPSVRFEKNSGEFLFANQFFVQYTPGSLTPRRLPRKMGGDAAMLNSGMVEIRRVEHHGSGCK